MLIIGLIIGFALGAVLMCVLSMGSRCSRMEDESERWEKITKEMHNDLKRIG